MEFRHHTSQGEPPHPNCCCIPLALRLPSVGAQPTLSCLLCTPYHVVVKLFLLSVHGYKASLQLVFSWLFKVIFLQFSCNFIWSWEEVSVGSTYSSTILDLGVHNSKFVPQPAISPTILLILMWPQVSVIMLSPNTFLSL